QPRVVLMTGSDEHDTLARSWGGPGIAMLRKPVQLQQLRALLDVPLQAERPRSSAGPDRLGDLIGRSEPMRRIFNMIQKVAPTDATVMLIGESGTGKEVIASTVHQNSTRRHRPFVAVNCGALPESLIDSELFGHDKGAFTGAIKDHRGVF